MTMSTPPPRVVPGTTVLSGRTRSQRGGNPKSGWSGRPTPLHPVSVVWVPRVPSSSSPSRRRTTRGESTESPATPVGARPADRAGLGPTLTVTPGVAVRGGLPPLVPVAPRRGAPRPVSGTSHGGPGPLAPASVRTIVGRGSRLLSTDPSGPDVTFRPPGSSRSGTRPPPSPRPRPPRSVPDPSCLHRRTGSGPWAPWSSFLSPTPTESTCAGSSTGAVVVGLNWNGTEEEGP